MTSPLVRIGVAALKGRALQQFAEEINELKRKGKIADDFAERKYGFQTWVELLEIIDSDTPDEDRLEALKAMFYAANKVNATDGEQILAYQLFQIAKTLGSNDLLVLKVLRELQSGKGHGFTTSAEVHNAVCEKIGHTVIELVQIAHQRLNEKKLLGGTTVTGLGIKVCMNIDQYQIDKNA